MLREDGIVVKVTYVLGDAFDSCSASKEAMITAASQGERGASAEQHHQQCVPLSCVVCILLKSFTTNCLRLCYTRRFAGNICATMYEP